MNPTKAVIYARYSSDNQREESIEGQIRECTEYAVRNDMTILTSYIDRALSARTADRPEFQRMIHDSEKGLFDAVLVWKLDRFSRNRYDSAHYKRILKKNGVRVISARENISEGPEGIILESMLEGYADCSWEEEGMAYLFTNTPFDSEIFAARCDGVNTLFTIMTVADGQVHRLIESDTALFQEPVTELYMEVDHEINIYFKSGSSMCYEKGEDQQWRLASYSKRDESGSFSVSMSDLITFYEYEDFLTGIHQEDRLCGPRLFDTDFGSVDAQNLPDSPEALKSSITASSSSESYMLDTMDVDDCSYYASCVLHGQTADVCVYADDEITRFHEDRLLRVTGFRVYIDGVYQKTADRKHSMTYDQYVGDSRFSLNVSDDSEKITIVPCWDDGSSDPAYSFVFSIK